MSDHSKPTPEALELIDALFPSQHLMAKWLIRYRQAVNKNKQPPLELGSSGAQVFLDSVAKYAANQVFVTTSQFTTLHLMLSEPKHHEKFVDYIKKHEQDYLKENYPNLLKKFPALAKTEAVSATDAKVVVTVPTTTATSGGVTSIHNPTHPFYAVGVTAAVTNTLFTHHDEVGQLAAQLSAAEKITAEAIKNAPPPPLVVTGLSKEQLDQLKEELAKPSSSKPVIVVDSITGDIDPGKDEKEMPKKSKSKPHSSDPYGFPLKQKVEPITQPPRVLPTTQPGVTGYQHFEPDTGGVAPEAPVKKPSKSVSGSKDAELNAMGF